MTLSAMVGPVSGDRAHERAQLAKRHVRAVSQVVEQRSNRLPSEAGFREARSHALAPLRHGTARKRMQAGGHVGSEDIAVAVVLVLRAASIFPIVEQLAAEDVTAHSPGMLPAALTQDAVAHADGVRIDHFVRAVAI